MIFPFQASLLTLILSVPLLHAGGTSIHPTPASLNTCSGRCCAQKRGLLSKPSPWFLSKPLCLALLSGSRGKEHRGGLGQFSPLESEPAAFPSHPIRGAARVHPRMLRNGKNHDFMQCLVHSCVVFLTGLTAARSSRT